MVERCHRQGVRRGVTMLEVIVSLTLVTTILFVSLSASAAIFANRTRAQDGLDAQILAGYLIDEVTSMEFEDDSTASVFGPEPGETASNRNSYDDVDDFDGFRQTSPTFRDGNAIPGYTDWQVDIEVDLAELSGGTMTNSANKDAPLRVVTVTVTSPEGQTHVARALVSNTATDRTPGSSYERLRRVEVSFSQDRKINVVVPLRNTPTPVY